MSAKTVKPLTDAALEVHEAQRDLGAELLQAVREMKAGRGRTGSKVVLIWTVKAAGKLVKRYLGMESFSPN